MRLGIVEMPKRSGLVYRALQDIKPGHSEGIGERMTGMRDSWAEGGGSASRERLKTRKPAISGLVH